MKVFIKGKVWELPNGTLESSREPTEWEPIGFCGSGGATVSVKALGPTRTSMDFKVPMTCCNKPLHKYLIKKHTKLKKLTMIVLFGGNSETEMKVKGYVVPSPVDMEQFTLEIEGEVKTRDRINWDKVENEAL